MLVCERLGKASSIKAKPHNREQDICKEKKEIEYNKTTTDVIDRLGSVGAYMKWSTRVSDGDRLK